MSRYKKHNFNKKVDRLITSIHSLTFGYCFNQTVDHLPASILELTFGYSFNQKVDYLPIYMYVLTFGDSFNQTVDHLPASIRYLTFGDSFNQKVDHLASLYELKFGHKFNQPVDYLPHVTNLIFGYSFNQKVDYLPFSHYLVFGHMFNQSCRFLVNSGKMFHKKLHIINMLNKFYEICFVDKIIFDNIYLADRTVLKLNEISYVLKNDVIFKNENFSFKIKYISSEILYKTKTYEFNKDNYIYCNVKKIPYGCSYKYI